MARWTDSLVNMISGLGTGKDKSSYNEYRPIVLLVRAQLEAAYRGDWLARKIVDIPAYDATREWRGWQADQDQITAIEKVEKQFSIQRKVWQALIRARLYGGSALIMGFDDDATQPLDPLKLKKDSLKFVHVLNRFEFGGYQLDWDVMSPFYGEPLYYQVSSQSLGSVQIHPSRVVRFIGNDLPDPRITSDGWGDSILQVVDDAVKQAGLSANGIASLIHECKVDVIKIPDLMKNVATEEYRDLFTERMQLVNISKSMLNTLVMDKEEDWERITQNFAQMPELLQAYMQIASGAADIPATRLLGQSPAGLNATGDSDIRNYYDRVSTEQENILRPHLDRLDKVLIVSALGTVPEEIHYVWNPLWQMNDAETATIAYQKAQAFQIDVNAGLINPDALRQARENQLIEDGTYPGFEAALEEADPAAEPDLTAQDPQVQAQFEIGKAAAIAQAKGGNMPAQMPTKDVAPMPLYVRRQVVNSNDIAKWAKAQGIKNLDDPAGFHVTVLYSRDAVEWMKIGSGWNSEPDGSLVIPAGGPRIVEKLGADAIVLSFSSYALCGRHFDMVNQGASHDFEDYQPHITIAHATSKVDLVNLANVEPYRGVIRLGPEIFEVLQPDAAQAA